jgi:hypothetical protein
MVLYVKVEEDSLHTIPFLLSSSTFTYNTILTVFLHFYIQYQSYCLPPLLHTIHGIVCKVEEDSKNGIVCKSGGRQ